MKIFADTGAWIAIADKNDRYHNIAKKVYASIRKKNIPVIITDYIFDETVTWLHYKLKRDVQRLLSGQFPSDYVIALTDVYTGSQPPEFVNANDAKEKMRLWVGHEPRFHPHVALHDFEAWLLPYWTSIQKLAGHNKTAPTGKPETVNHTNPPAYRIKEIFEIGRSRDSYVKPRDAGRILSKNDLGVAVAECPELKAFVNTIISVCGGKIL